MSSQRRFVWSKLFSSISNFPSILTLVVLSVLLSLLLADYM